jgi:hypothetical protein
VSTNYRADNNDLTPSSFTQPYPSKFRVGDIVEVQTTVVAVPVKNKRFRVINQLRSIALLNGKFMNVSYYNLIESHYADKRR